MTFSMLLSLFACTPDLSLTGPPSDAAPRAPLVSSASAERISPAREEAIVRHMALADIEATQDDIDRLDALLAEIEPRIDLLIEHAYAGASETLGNTVRAVLASQADLLMRDIGSRIDGATFAGAHLVGTPVRRAVPAAWGGPLEVPLPNLLDLANMSASLDFSTASTALAAISWLELYAVRVDVARNALVSARAAADAAEAAILASGVVPRSCEADRTLDHALAQVEIASARTQVRRAGSRVIRAHLLNLRRIAIDAAQEGVSDADRAALQASFDTELAEIETVAATTTFDGVPVLEHVASAYIRPPDALLHLGLPTLIERGGGVGAYLPVATGAELADLNQANATVSMLDESLNYATTTAADYEGQQETFGLLIEDLSDRCAAM